ncbi:Chromosomal replication initiator protein DnaA [Frankliniella fusca]|uniref:Chromosomal replication initiator protein DnaA n=1 Tax=Frankliniella fusca TaxID=407009 RepID=A0AAE1LLI7_9NEOP|nr:Chromosomal replication initiator protein DnaA [Frankliniella fusca]
MERPKYHCIWKVVLENPDYFHGWAVVICGSAQYFAPTFNSADSEDPYDFKELLLFCWLNGIKATPTWWLICGSHHKEMNIFAVECYWYVDKVVNEF